MLPGNGRSKLKWQHFVDKSEVLPARFRLKTTLTLPEGNAPADSEPCADGSQSEFLRGERAFSKACIVVFSCRPDVEWESSGKLLRLR